MTEAVVELTLSDGRARCTKVHPKKGQCKNEAGFNTTHVGSGMCYYHEEKVEIVVPSTTPIDQLAAPSSRSKVGIYDNALKGDAKKLYDTLSGNSKRELLDMSDELAMAKASLAELREGTKDRDGYWSDVAKLLDTISKLVERSQPKSTLTVTTVQKVLLQVVDIIAQEVQDKSILERVIQKLAAIQVVQK